MALVDLMSVMNILPSPEAQRPDSGEKRLCMAMIRDVIGTLDEIALGKPIKKQSKLLMFQDTIAWVEGKHPASCELTFERVCDVLGWEPGFVGPELLKRAKGIKPKIKVGTLHQERGVMARRLGIVIKRRKAVKIESKHAVTGRGFDEGQDRIGDDRIRDEKVDGGSREGLQRVVSGFVGSSERLTEQGECGVFLERDGVRPATANHGGPGVTLVEAQEIA